MSFKSFGIELTEQDSEELKIKWNCETDAELRNRLQQLVNNQIRMRLDTTKELQDLIDSRW